ncbi:hypothetical protein MAR_002219 [Mya arenaria]|uniref:Uncharacterized protein n=1 Tax=Mya arenaria TaxID=6604 RepID=A0ABY7FMD2_MYAAR|nr:hypothetical protein MAR_002219 [Mya arenaria]
MGQISQIIYGGMVIYQFRVLCKRLFNTDNQKLGFLSVSINKNTKHQKRGTPSRDDRSTREHGIQWPFKGYSVPGRWKYAGTRYSMALKRYTVPGRWKYAGTRGTPSRDDGSTREHGIQWPFNEYSVPGRRKYAGTRGTPSRDDGSTRVHGIQWPFKGYSVPGRWKYAGTRGTPSRDDGSTRERLGTMEVREYTVFNGLLRGTPSRDDGSTRSLFLSHVEGVARPKLNQTERPVESSKLVHHFWPDCFTALKMEYFTQIGC